MPDDTDVTAGRGTPRLKRPQRDQIEFRACCWNDVGIDICEHKGRFYVLEANMKYGKEGFRKAGLDYDQLMESMIANEEI